MLLIAVGNGFKEEGFGLEDFWLGYFGSTEKFIEDIDLIKIIGGRFDIFVDETESIEIEGLSFPDYF